MITILKNFFKVTYYYITDKIKTDRKIHTFISNIQTINMRIKKR